MTETGPAAARVLLGRELRDLRVAAGLDHKAVAESVSWHLPKVYRSEGGEAGLKAAEIDQLLTLYKADKPAAERLRAIGAQARRRGSYGKVPDWSRQYFGLEQDAVELAFHQGEMIPGLFQTEAYARALISTSVVVSPVDVDQTVEARMRRRSLFDRENPPRLHLVLGEAALHRQVGGASALAEQLDYLAGLARLPHVTMQVLPYTTGAHAAMSAGFILLTLEIGDRPTRWVFLDELTRGECRSDVQQVRTYQMTFDSLMVNALGEAETITKLEQTRDGLR